MIQPGKFLWEQALTAIVRNPLVVAGCRVADMRQVNDEGDAAVASGTAEWEAVLLKTCSPDVLLVDVQRSAGARRVGWTGQQRTRAPVSVWALGGPNTQRGSMAQGLAGLAMLVQEITDRSVRLGHDHQ